MKTIYILTVILSIVVGLSGYSVAAKTPGHLPSENIPLQIAVLQNDSASINMLLSQMRSSLQNRSPMKSHDAYGAKNQLQSLESDTNAWNYFESEEFESH